jgi:hypothetical protein
VNLFTGEPQFHASFNESFNSMTFTIGAQNVEGLPYPGIRLTDYFPGRFGPLQPIQNSTAAVSLFDHAVAFPFRTQKDFVNRVGLKSLHQHDHTPTSASTFDNFELSPEEIKKLPKRKRGEYSKLQAESFELLKTLEPSHRRGAELIISRPLARFLPSTNHAFRTSVEKVTHMFMPVEHIIASRYTATALDKNWSKLGEHLCTASLVNGVRIPSPPSPLSSLSSKKPRFSTFSIDSVSQIPLHFPGLKLFVKSSLLTSFNSSVPLHYRDFNGVRLGEGMRGWSLKDHGPVTDGFRTTGELRVRCGPRLTCVVFSDLLAVPRSHAWVGDPSATQQHSKTAFVKKTFAALSSAANGLRSAGSLGSAKEELQKSAQKAIVKTSAGAGIRVRVGETRWIGFDVARMNSGFTKVALKMGSDFTAEELRNKEEISTHNFDL